VVGEWPEGLQPALIVDGLLGIGLARDVDLRFAGIIARINASGVPVLAIDCPSGIDSASGAVRGSAVLADHTITFIAHKVGLHTADALDHRGSLTLDDLGVGTDAASIAKGSLLTCELVKDWLQPRPRNSHKGRFGAVAIIGGNRGMVGAALLAARSALLCGAGKVRAGLLSSDAPPVDFERPEIMLGPVDDAMEMEVIVAGPGAGQSPSATSVSMFERTILPALIAAAKPVVFDADALNAIAFNATLETALVARRSGPTILTPHPAEAARLLHKGTPEVNDDRLGAALAIAQTLQRARGVEGRGQHLRVSGWSLVGEHHGQRGTRRRRERRRAGRHDRRLPRAKARARKGAAIRGLPPRGGRRFVRRSCDRPHRPHRDGRGPRSARPPQSVDFEPVESGA
jgi:hypothetical protein